MFIDYEHKRGEQPQAESLKEAAMFANISTKTLVQMNVTYGQEYRANPTAANMAAVIQSGEELTRRGA